MTKTDDLIELHRAWWKLENEKPLLNVIHTEHFPWTWLQSDQKLGMELFLSDGTLAKDGPLTPDMLSTEMMHNMPFSRGDLFLPIMPFHKIPWVEAICGVTPQISVKGDSIWAGFSEGIWPADWWARDMEIQINEDWLDLLVETTKYCAQKFSESFVIAQTAVMRGPIDVMAALVGDKNVILGMYRHSEETKRLLDRITNICLMVMKAQNEVIPSFREGYVNCWGIWAPGTVTRTQEDGAAYISPKLYAEFLQSIDGKICQTFDYATIHLHSAHHMHVDAIANIEKLGAIQLILEPPPYGPTLKDWMPILKRIIKKKPLILSAQCLNREQVNMLLKELPPQGLCLMARVQETGENRFSYKQ